MKFWILLLKGFAYVWLTMVVTLMLISIVYLWLTKGFAAVQEIWSPWNVWNSLAVGITLAPGIYAREWARRLDVRQSQVKAL